MLDILSLKDGQLDSTTDTIVGTKSGTFCLQPVAVNISLDSILVEIEVYIHQLVAYHIHMTLQDNGLLIFVTLSGRFANENITNPIRHC